VGDPDTNTNPTNRRERTVFAAYKRNVAKRKAARAEATKKFHARIAEINKNRDIELALIDIERQANREHFIEKITQNNEMLKAAWRQ
jgi:hypothetical protein